MSLRGKGQFWAFAFVGKVDGAIDEAISSMGSELRAPFSR